MRTRQAKVNTRISARNIVTHDCTCTAKCMLQEPERRNKPNPQL
jgi:hypothetical protein